MAYREKDTKKWTAQWFETNVMGEKKKRRKRGFETKRELLIVEKENDGKPFDLHTSYEDRANYYSNLRNPWLLLMLMLAASPLYYRYEDTAQGKAFSGVGKNFVRELYSEIENKKEYEFLRGNKELELIFEEHLK